MTTNRIELDEDGRIYEISKSPVSREQIASAIERTQGQITQLRDQLAQATELVQIFECELVEFDVLCPPNREAKRKARLKAKS